MLKKLANSGIHRPRLIGLLALMVLLVTGVIGSQASGVLKAPNAFEDPGSQAAAARRQIERATGAQPAAGILALVEAAPRSAPAAAAAHTLASDPGIARVVTYTQTHDPRLISRDGRSTVIAASLRAGTEPTNAVERIKHAFAGSHTVLLGGSDVAQQQVDEQASQDLGFAEVLIFPLLALLAFGIFRGVAVLLPLLVGVLSVLTAFTALVAINAALPLSIFALNLVFGLGLGLAIDYSLFLVSRFREELGRGAEVPDAIRVTMTTAGRTVIFSALTVAGAGASLVIFPMRFLQSMGLGCAIVALLAAAVSLTFLPAAFMLLGQRIGRYVPGPEREGRWYRIAHAVMRRSGIVAAATATVLVLVAIPGLHAHWSGVDASILPTSKSARVVNDKLATSFRSVDSTPMVIAISARRSALREVATESHEVAQVRGVTNVTHAHYVGSGIWQLEADTSGSAIAPQAQRAVDRVRDLPAAFRVAVGGEAAEFHDLQAAISSNLPLALGILLVMTLLILWIMTGSVVLPVKAVAMNALTVGVATGVLVLVFQDNRFTSLLSYRGQGGIESTDFLLLVMIAFALSTDYGVFLLTRIKEARDSGIDDREAVAVGLQRSGRIVTAAAILLAVAIGAFVTSQIIFLKEIGIGAAVAVLIDAFAVRALLVPSLMGLLGRWNWWQPAPLRRLHSRIDIRQDASTGREPTTTAA